jgi:sporulation protein YlmC with PRC-barrel domain
MEENMKRTLAIVVCAALMAATALTQPTLAADDMQTADELRTSKIVGSSVYNEANENIGSVEDIVLKADGSIDEVVLSVGGFLGIGDKFVSVPFSDLKVTRDGDKLKVAAKGTKESLKAHPDYKFYKQ